MPREIDLSVIQKILAEDYATCGGAVENAAQVRQGAESDARINRAQEDINNFSSQRAAIERITRKIEEVTGTRLFIGRASERGIPPFWSPKPPETTRREPQR